MPLFFICLKKKSIFLQNSQSAGIVLDNELDEQPEVGCMLDIITSYPDQLWYL